MKLVLVGNKVDLQDQRQVSLKRGEKVSFKCFGTVADKHFLISLHASTKYNFSKQVHGKMWPFQNPLHHLQRVYLVM